MPGPTSPCSRGEVDDGLRFAHLCDAHLQGRLAELSANFNALVETLIGEGALPLDAYERRRALTIARENQRSENDPQVILNEEPDKYALTDLPVIDCASKLPVCKARCCTLEVALSLQDLNERSLRWAYRRPYVLEMRKDDGYCVHSDGERRCTVYAQRPAICRTYDCRDDKRIWKDFDNNIPADMDG